MTKQLRVERWMDETRKKKNRNIPLPSTKVAGGLHGSRLADPIKGDSDAERTKNHMVHVSNWINNCMQSSRMVMVGNVLPGYMT